MNKLAPPFVALALAWALPAAASAAGLSLTIHGGRVSLDADGVTLRQILVEWERAGKTRIVNIERVNSGPMTLKLDDVPEEQALDILLRALPGYVAAPRTARQADASIFDRILVMPTTTAVAVAARPQAPGFQGYPTMTQLRPGDLDDPSGASEQAIAAARAAGLIATPAPAGASNGIGPTTLQLPGAAAAQPAAAPSQPASNPWNVPVSAPMPGLAPPPPPPAAQPPRPATALRPPQADQ